MRVQLIQIGLALVTVSAASAQSDPDIAEFFERFNATRGEITQLEARFVQTTVTPDETVESTGTIVYARTGETDEGIQGKRLVFRYDDPPLEYMIDGLTAYEYDPELQQIQIFELEDRPEAEAFYLGFGSDAERLTEAYALRLQPPADSNPGGVAVALVPRDPESEEALFEMVVLQLRAGDLMPVQIHIVNSAESETSYEITATTVSDTLDPEAVTIHVPEGTAIVDQDDYAGTAPEGGMRFPLPGDVEPGRVDAEELEGTQAP